MAWCLWSALLDAIHTLSHTWTHTHTHTYTYTHLQTHTRSQISLSLLSLPTGVGYAPEVACKGPRIGLSLYYFHIVRWLNILPRDHILFLRTEDFLTDPYTAMKKVTDQFELHSQVCRKCIFVANLQGFCTWRTYVWACIVICIHHIDCMLCFQCSGVLNCLNGNSSTTFQYYLCDPVLIIALITGLLFPGGFPSSYRAQYDYPHQPECQ